MKSELSKLIKDTIAYVKNTHSLPYSESYSISNKAFPKIKKETLISSPKVSFTPPVKKEVKQPILQKPAEKPPIVKKENRSFIDAKQNLEVMEDPLQDIWKLIKQIEPNLPLCRNLPDDRHAHQIAEKWKYQSQAHPISILTTYQEGREYAFLCSLAKAIEIHFFDAKVVFAKNLEKENRWEDFFASKNIKLLIAPDTQIWDLPHLMTHYKEVPSKSLKTLGGLPLLLLPNLEMYFRDPLLKKSLWKAICQMMSTIS